MRDRHPGRNGRPSEPVPEGSFAERLRLACAGKDLVTAVDLADLIGVAPNTARNWWRNACLPRPDAQILLADALGVSVQWLMYGRD